MSISPTISFKDSASFTLHEASLTVDKIGDFFTTALRDVPCSDGLKWGVEWCPAGVTEEVRDHISVYLYVNKAASVKFSLAISGSTIQRDFVHNFPKAGGWGPRKFASHEHLRQLFVSGKVTITCNTEFDIPVPFNFLAVRLAQHSDHVPTDFALVSGSNRLPVHKSVLSLMSPVFHDMFSHDTVQVTTLQAEIMDFDFDIVKTIVDFCYGRPLATPSVGTVVSMLRFADKYDIKAVTDQLENIPRSSLSISTFSTIVQYSYDCSKDTLFAECVKFFKDHKGEIKALQDFVNLPLPVIMRILKSAFHLKTYSDVFRHARDNDYGFIIERLENLASVSLDTFFIAVNYAWQYSQDDLKEECAVFYNDNRETVMSMKAIVDLPPETLHGVAKLALELNATMEGV